MTRLGILKVCSYYWKENAFLTSQREFGFKNSSAASVGETTLFVTELRVDGQALQVRKEIGAIYVIGRRIHGNEKRNRNVNKFRF